MYSVQNFHSVTHFHQFKYFVKKLIATLSLILVHIYNDSILVYMNCGNNTHPRYCTQTLSIRPESRIENCPSRIMDWKLPIENLILKTIHGECALKTTYQESRIENYISRIAYWKLPIKNRVLKTTNQESRIENYQSRIPYLKLHTKDRPCKTDIQRSRIENYPTHTTNL